MPQAKLLIIGAGNDRLKEEIEKKIIESGLKDNITSKDT